MAYVTLVLSLPRTVPGPTKITYTWKNGKKITTKTATTKTEYTRYTYPLKIKEIGWDPQLKNVVKPYVGANGSSTLRSGTGGRLLDLTVYADDRDIDMIQSMVDTDKYFQLISPSKAKYNGNYYIIDLKTTEKKKGLFPNVTIKLQEYNPFNVVYMNFTNNEIKIPQTSKGELKIGQKWNPGNE